MATTVERLELATIHEKLEEHWTPKGNPVFSWFATVDHKKIGKRYLATAYAFLIIGGLEALLMRVQLIRPENTFLTPEQYNEIFTMHGTTMIWWYAAPILSGFSNYLVPLMIGARDMAFPRLNAFSYWAFLLSGLVLYVSLPLASMPNGGWFAYTPLTGPQYSPNINMEFYAFALLFLTVSTTAGAINFIVTIFKLRCPGMSVSRMPLFMWSTLTNSVSVIFALPSLTAALIFLELERQYGFHFFTPTRGGDPLLWQHLFWVFGHPWVYIVILPATGMTSMILPSFCRRPIVGHTYVALATVSTGIIGFGVWVHHMFATGLPDLSTTFFSAASQAVVLPSAIQIFAWLATIWAARRHVFSTAMLFALGFIVLFVIGGVSGVMTGSVPFDWQVTDTYFVVAHLHYVLIGINLFPVMAAFYYWLPKMTGRMLNETLGKWNFWLMFIGFGAGFFPMHNLGLAGMPRRIYTYQSGMGWTTDNVIVSVGAFVFAFGVLLFLINLAWCVWLRRGRIAGANPWGAASLEWATSSPPPEYNHDVIPTVTSREPLWDTHDEIIDDPEPELAPPDSSRAEGTIVTSLQDRHVEEEHPHLTVPAFRALIDGKEALESTLLDGAPQAALTMPHETLWPLVTNLCLTGLFLALIFKLVVLAAAFGVLVLICAAAWLWPTEETFPA
ncbi:MAG TPA: cytochrome c oxidase subunit I [Gemmatimonadaceae bacterium]|nr:cytochrome c oxidase subunit I [Gemmatimonadaceae bacterium]